MPQLKSSAKRLRQSLKKFAANKKIKTGIDYLYNQFKKALASNNRDKAAELAKQLSKALDKAAQKRTFKKTTASRKKSRLMKKFNQAIK